MVGADLAARLLGEIPVGVVTAVIGAPFFLALLRRARTGLRAVIRLDGVTVLYRERAALRDVTPPDRRRRAGRDHRAQRRRKVHPPPGRRRAPAARRRHGRAGGASAWTGWTGSPSRGASPSSRSSPTLPFATTVEEVVALGRLPHEHPDPRYATRATGRRSPRPSSASAWGTSSGRDARELSLGERQLVLLAMAVAQAAPVLVLDEPTVHLDLRHQVEVMELVGDLNARDGTTILAVLHDLGLAAHFFPRLVLLDRGRIVADGPPRRGPRPGPDPRGVRGGPGVRPTATARAEPRRGATLGS